jgi:hypothetical protein
VNEDPFDPHGGGIDPDVRARVDMPCSLLMSDEEVARSFRS